jgi:hypothetical protein
VRWLYGESSSISTEETEFEEAEGEMSSDDDTISSGVESVL